MAPFPIPTEFPMKLLKSALLVAALVAGGPALADEAARVEAARLLDVLKMQQAIDSMADATLDAQIRQQPQMAPYRGVMLGFFHKYMNYASLKDDMVRIYSEEFTATELREITAFYSTPTGRKTIERMPALVAKGAQMGAARVQAHMDELKQLIDAESQRLQREAEAQRQQADATAKAAAAKVDATDADDTAHDEPAKDEPVDKP